MDDLVPFGSRGYALGVLLLLVARGADLLSTLIATPNLVLEGNPLVKRLGLKWSIALNVVVCFAVAFLPLGVVIGATISLLVAARNFQSAWALRTAGELHYRAWREQQLTETPVSLFLFCVLAESALFLVIGLVLVWSSRQEIVPLGIGLGTVLYALAVAFYMSISLWRNRHALR